MRLVRDAYKWLKSVMVGPLVPVEKAWKLCPPKVWERYFQLGGFEDCAEMKILLRALNALRKSISARERPTFYRKSVRNGHIKKILTALESKGKSSK